MKKLTRAITAAFSPSYVFYVLANKYIKYYEGFSYKFSRNGEEKFLNSLANEEIKVVLDVGANIGSWTKIALKKFPNAKVHSFELSELTYKNLCENLSDENRVVLNNIGLADKAGTLNYKDYGANSGVNTLICEADFHDKGLQPKIKKAELLTGSQYCQENNIKVVDLLKIDVEGAEHLVLEGFVDFLEKGRIKAIQFEYGYTHADAKFLIKDFYKFLEGYGYKLGPLKPSGVLFTEFDYALNGFNSGPNYVAVHQSELSMITAVRGKWIKGYPRK